MKGAHDAEHGTHEADQGRDEARGAEQADAAVEAEAQSLAVDLEGFDESFSDLLARAIQQSFIGK